MKLVTPPCSLDLFKRYIHTDYVCLHTYVHCHVDCFVLTDGCGCLADIASASREHLIDCTLEPASADTVVTFFSEDVIVA